MASSRGNDGDQGAGKLAGRIRWQRAVARVREAAARAESRLDGALFAWRRRSGGVAPVEIIPYRGYGTRERVTLQGRVLESRGVEPPADRDRTWRNFVRMVHRLESNEIPRVRVRAEMGGRVQETTTDDEGYFTFSFADPALPETGGPWHAIRLELLDRVVARQETVAAIGEVVIPDHRADLAVVSDVDDTVIQTHVTSLLRMLKVTMLGSARTRLPFEGTTDLYRALVAGPTGLAANPVFYVSKSPWNLYDLLTDFMDRHELPRGPLLLRDFGLHRDPAIDHKREGIRGILATYPRMPVVLIGDSGESDPEIYLDIAAEHPGRVRAIYIREVGTKRRRREDAALASEAAKYGAEMLLVSHAQEALAHARARGLVSAR